MMETNEEEEISHPYVQGIETDDEKEENQCYICLSDCNDERLFCECKAPVHYECYRDFCEANGSAMCSICKTVPLEYREINFKPIVTSEFSCLRYTVAYFSVFIFFSLIITASTFAEGTPMTHLVNYVIMALFSVPIVSICGVRKTVDFQTTFEPTTV